VLKEPLRVVNGVACVEDVVGTGVEWNESAVSRYVV
jgi:mandelate racemase